MLDGWAEVFRTGDPMEAELIRGLLESGGIEAIVDSERVSQYPVNVGKMSYLRVYVRPEDKQDAVGLLNEPAPPDAEL